MIEIEEEAGEESSICFFIIVKDEDNNNVLIPNSMKYTLVDLSENVVNDIEQIEIDSDDLGASIVVVNGVDTASTKIVLSGDDLQITAIEHSNYKVKKTKKVIRNLIIEITYDGECGNSLPKKDYIQFPIENIPYIGN